MLDLPCSTPRLAPDTLWVAWSKRLYGEAMLSLKEIKEWADTIEVRSRLKLIKFSHDSAAHPEHAVTEIVFGEGANEYRVRIFRKFNIIYVDAFHQNIEADSKVFRGAVTRRSFESISRILRRSQP